MSPPPKNDWWLAAALSTAAVPGALAQQAPATRPDAVVTTVARPGSAQPGTRHVQVPADSVQGRRLVTDGQTSIHVLFADQSAITVGPNSDVVVQQYRYDDKARDGSIVVQLTKGFLRMVGGAISKRSPATVLTPTATIGIRGGISIVQVDGPTTNAAFLFGDQLTMQQGDQSGSIFRPGFAMAATPLGLMGPSKEIFAVVLTFVTSFTPIGPVFQNPLQGLDPDTIFQFHIGPYVPDPLLNDGDVTPPNLQDIIGTPGPGNQS